MKISEAAKIIEKCMGVKNTVPTCDNCPLLKEVVLKIGNAHDEHGGITWRLQGCSLMEILRKAVARHQGGE